MRREHELSISPEQHLETRVQNFPASQLCQTSPGASLTIVGDFAWPMLLTLLVNVSSKSLRYIMHKEMNTCHLISLPMENQSIFGKMKCAKTVTSSGILTHDSADRAQSTQPVRISRTYAGRGERASALKRKHASAAAGEKMRHCACAP